MSTDQDYLSTVRHFWRKCEKCPTPKEPHGFELKEYIKVNEEIICQGCDPIRFNNIKYGEPLKIQKPSQENKP